jgi:hypothetical protein
LTAEILEVNLYTILGERHPAGYCFRCQDLPCGPPSGTTTLELVLSRDLGPPAEETYPRRSGVNYCYYHRIMTSSLKFPFTSCNVTSTDGDLHWPQVSVPGLSTNGHARRVIPQGDWDPKTTLKTSCFALSEQDVLKVFLGESLPEDNNFCLPNVCEVLDPLSSGLVGSLSAGSAGMIETQIALSNWESTHQTSRGQGHLFDYDQICDSSRGLVSARPI